jgi:hypothetical protein
MEVASSSEISVAIYQPIQQYASEDCRLVAIKKSEKRGGTTQELGVECNLSLITVL